MLHLRALHAGTMRNATVTSMMRPIDAAAAAVAAPRPTLGGLLSAPSLHHLSPPPRRRLHAHTALPQQSHTVNTAAAAAAATADAATAPSASASASDPPSQAEQSDRAQRLLTRAAMASLRYERARAEREKKQNRPRQPARLHQPAVVKRLCEQLERLSLRVRDRFPVRRADLRGDARQRLHADPKWAAMHAEGAAAMQQVLSVVRAELERPPAVQTDGSSAPDEISQLSARQWQVLVLACKNLGLESCALPLYTLMREHLLHPLRDSPAYELRPDSLRRLQEREVNVIIECVGHDNAGPARQDNTGPPRAAAGAGAGKPNGASSQTELSPLPVHGGPQAALHLLRDMQHPLLAGHFAVTGSTSGVALVSLAAAAPPAAPAGASPAEVTAAADARAAHLESVRACYASLACKDGHTHSAMLGIYLGAGEHASMRALLSSLDGQGAPLVAACMGAMLTSVHAQLEAAASGSELAAALLHAAERYWRRAKLLPQLNAVVTLTMMRVCAMVWDADRQLSVLHEAVRLEQEHEATHRRRTKAAESRKKLLAPASESASDSNANSSNTNTGSSSTSSSNDSTRVPSAPHHSLGYLYATPACFGLLFHTLATRTASPAGELAAAQAAWATLQQRHAQAKEAQQHERERALRVDSSTADSYSRLLHRAQPASADALQLQLRLWQSVPRNQRFGAESRALLIRLLGQLPQTPEGWAQADRLARSLDDEGYPWSAATITALLRALQRTGGAKAEKASRARHAAPPSSSAASTVDTAAAPSTDSATPGEAAVADDASGQRCSSASSPSPASGAVADARAAAATPPLADSALGAAAWARFDRLRLQPSASAYCAYIQLLIRAGSRADLQRAEALWAEASARDRAQARAQRSALRRGLNRGASGHSGLAAAAPVPSAPLSGVRFHSGHMGALVKAARATGRPAVVRRWAFLALEAGYGPRLDPVARGAMWPPQPAGVRRSPTRPAARSLSASVEPAAGSVAEPSGATSAAVVGDAGHGWVEPNLESAVAADGQSPARPTSRAAARWMRRKQQRARRQAAMAHGDAVATAAVPVDADASAQFSDSSR